jgi:hypothetical protein
MSKPFLTCYGLWCSLGAYRGVQDYSKKYNKEYKYHTENPNSKKPQYYYTVCFSSSILGIICYANPFTLPFFAYAEIINLEKKIRGIKDE